MSALPERPSATATSDRVKASRRSWLLEEKRRIVEEAFLPGTSVADVARRHGLNSNQVFNWRKLWVTPPTTEASSTASPAQPDAAPACAPDGFLSIGVITEPRDEGTSSAAQSVDFADGTGAAGSRCAGAPGDGRAARDDHCSSVKCVNPVAASTLTRPHRRDGRCVRLDTRRIPGYLLQ